jgi:hypothetical protein
MLVIPSVVAPSVLHASYQWESRAQVRILAQPGGAGLLRLLVGATCDLSQPDGAISVSGGRMLPEVLRDPGNEALTRTYTVWQPYPREDNGRALVWRMHQFLGVQPARGGSDPVGDEATSVPDCLVIDDANLGYREQSAAWPLWLRDPSETRAPQHIILKMSNPVGAGPLWQQLVASHADRLTIYCSVGDLRKEYARIGQPLSWERTSSDVVKAIRSRADLSSVARVIVTLGMSGAVIVERGGSSTLVYDPLHQEGDWERRHPGTPVGLGTCITAALAVECARLRGEPDWPRAASHGLDAARTLHNSRLVSDEEPESTGPHIPFEPVAQAIYDGHAQSCFETVSIPDTDDWQIFASTVTGGNRSMAARIVIEGETQACRKLPIERVGAWASIDRTEIESMRSVRNIIHEYLSSRRSRPLSLAVFGPPGSGKSFAIKQIARESTGSARIQVLEFNLSQFSDPDELPTALQRVRDSTVEGVLPLVFWDEFDTALAGRELGWLARFLAPMQDGTFAEDGIARPIGPAIFIFAGGTHATLASFKARAIEIPGAKATDFLSRLRGFVDILGPNPTEPGDDTFQLRRALLLRALLRDKVPDLFRSGRLDIDPGVLRAFLDVTTYVHGARSMESIVDMSSLSGTLRYERSALPPRHQLGLHVDPDEFLGLVEPA